METRISVKEQQGQEGQNHLSIRYSARQKMWNQIVATVEMVVKSGCISRVLQSFAKMTQGAANCCSVPVGISEPGETTSGKVLLTHMTITTRGGYACYFGSGKHDQDSCNIGIKQNSVYKCDSSTYEWNSLNGNYSVRNTFDTMHLAKCVYH